MEINGRKIGPSEPPYIIAEISGNHGGVFENAVYLMGLAIGCGADAVKLQCYTPDTITIDCDKPDFIIKDGPWKGRKLHELYRKTHTPLEWFPELFAIAKQYGTTLFASVFDKTSVDLLESLGCPAYKIASMEIVDIPLIQYAAQTGKPLILSTGMASEDDIGDALDCLDGLGRPQHSTGLLHCISGYPTPMSEANLQRMQDLALWVNCAPGLSDHTRGWEIPVAATAMGAQIIEKHLCMFRDEKFEDSEFSLEPEEFRAMCKSVKAVWQAMQPSEAKSEEPSRQLRRSLYVVEDIKAGELFTEKNVRSIRPGYGMPPKELRNVLGRIALHNIEKGTALSANIIQGA